MGKITNLTKREMIEHLEGREVQTGDLNWHLVKGGKFKPTMGAEVKLARLHKRQLRLFVLGSRRNRD